MTWNPLSLFLGVLLSIPIIILWFAVIKPWGRRRGRIRDERRRFEALKAEARRRT